MAKALTVVGALLVGCILVLGAVAYLARSEDKLAIDAILSERITRAVGVAEQRGEGRIDLRRLAPFDWDQLLLVERGTDPETISRAVGREWPGDVPFEMGDILIFVRGGRVARYAEYRGEGAFAGVRRPIDRFAREEAVFSVRGLTLRPVARAEA
jgi:hypothetical protein